MRKSLFVLALLAGASVMPQSASAVTLSNAPNGGSISAFGVPDSQTYGQVFTAPVTGTLTSFTLWLNGSVGGDLYGGVGTWNGSAAYGVSGGVGSNLFTSGNILSSAGVTPYTFATNISVTAGSLYVAYLSVFGTNATTSTSMPLGFDTPGINYFVWNNGTSPTSVAWNYFFNAGDARFEANFEEVTPVPIPAALPLMLVGLASLAGAGFWRMKYAS